jgi:hypothetical protein
MKQHITSIFFILAFTGASLALSASAYAESARDAILKDKVANGIATQEKKRYVTLTVENDLFSGTDRNYTNGLRLGWFDLGAKPPGLTRKIEDMVPLFQTNETTSTFSSIGQNMFTPEDVESSVQDPNDRPWAAFLYGSMGTITLKDEGYVDELELTLGVVGPMALGEQAQKTIHSLINSTNPKGWDNQLKNEPGLMVSWQRRWPEQFKVDVGDLFLAASPHAGVTLGNIYTYGNIGGMVKLSSEHSRWDDKPLQVKPAMPGTGFFVPSDTPQWEVFAGVEGRAVARNIFLDGNTFADSHSVDKKPFVADLSAGVAFTWGPTRLSYTATYRTKEFDTQEDAAVFGGVSLGYNF